MMVVDKIVAFWKRYENLNLRIALILMGLQIIHLTWLTTDVVLARLVSESFVTFPDVLVPLLILVDYIEIPALISGITFYSLLVINKKPGWGKGALYIVMLAVQLLHIFWITDEFVVNTFFESDLVAIPFYLAWVAIFIDYLELPVIADLINRVVRRKK